MEPKRLTDDELRDIRARAELFKPSDLSDYKLIELYDWAHTQFIVQKLAGYTHVGMVVDELQGRRRMAADIPALLAHADALAAENARLRGERRVMHDVLLTLVSHIHMRAHPSNRTKWVCPYCKGTHKSLTALEEGEGHTENCPYAAARALLEGGA